MIETDIVYYVSNDIMNRYHKINEEKINVYKISKFQDYGSITIIDELFLIKVSDITAFDFTYGLEDLEN